MNLKKILDFIYSKQEKIEKDYYYVSKTKILGMKFSHHLSPKDFIKTNLHTKNNEKLYVEIHNKVKRFNKIYLCFDHAMGGGADTYFQNQIRNLDNNSIILRIQYCINSYKCYKLSVLGGCKNIEVYEKNIKTLLENVKKFGIDTIIINNLVGYPSIYEIFEEIKNLKNNNPYINIIMMGHDFHSLCPTFKLIDSELKLCNGKFNANKCKKCLKTNLPSVLKSKEIETPSDITTWQKNWKAFLVEYADEIRCFSPSTKTIFEQAFSEIKDKITLVPHEFIPFKNSINIGIIGSMNYHKGSKIIDNLVEYLILKNIWDLKIYIIGTDNGTIKHKKIPNNKIIFLGKYNREKLPTIIEENNIDIIFIPSILNETFSYTTQEAINLGYPVLCFNLGGQADQVKEYEKGVIIETFEPETIYKTIKNTYKRFVKEEKDEQTNFYKI